MTLYYGQYVFTRICTIDNMIGYFMSILKHCCFDKSNIINSGVHITPTAETLQLIAVRICLFIGEFTCLFRVTIGTEQIRHVCFITTGSLVSLITHHIVNTTQCTDNENFTRPTISATPIIQNIAIGTNKEEVLQDIAGLWIVVVGDSVFVRYLYLLFCCILIISSYILNGQYAIRV